MFVTMGAASVPKFLNLLARDITTVERQRKRLKRHERQLSDMASAIAHELRNSVTITNGYLEAAAGQLDAGDPTAARESVETARSTDHALSMLGISVEATDDDTRDPSDGVTDRSGPASSPGGGR